MLDQCGGGVSYTPDDHKDLAQKIMVMKGTSWTYRRKMGKSARLFVEKHHSRRVQAAKLEKLIVDGQNQ